MWGTLLRDIRQMCILPMPEWSHLCGRRGQLSVSLPQGNGVVHGQGLRGAVRWVRFRGLSQLHQHSRHQGLQLRLPGWFRRRQLHSQNRRLRERPLPGGEDGVRGWRRWLHLPLPRRLRREDCRTGVGACLEEPCLNNGSCVPLPDGGGHRCQCGPGFGGPRCEEDVDECQSHPCQNGAICMDRANGYQCFCVPGFQGYHCEIDINECASRPCENNGTCVNEKDRYSCECLLGYTGVNCEVEIDECESDPCRNGATCHDHVGLYVCQCPAGFEGLDCEIDIDECESAPCLNEGTCNDLVDSYECDCSDTGFTGEACEVDIPECASNPCQNNATCQEGIKSYSCLCWPGYEGDHCEIDIDECAVEPCQNGGHCFERSNMTNYGKLPQLDWQFSYADAAGHLCECLPGFTGENCSVNIDECESSPCQNGASCEDLVNSYKCICPAGYTGTDCETDIDECESGPCQNGAECEDGVARYTCRCPAPTEPGRSPGGAATAACAWWAARVTGARTAPPAPPCWRTASTGTRASARPASAGTCATRPPPSPSPPRASPCWRRCTRTGAGEADPGARREAAVPHHPAGRRPVLLGRRGDSGLLLELAGASRAGPSGRARSWRWCSRARSATAVGGRSP
ncbi:hypothetical protein ANANG_G00192340 [Anguilla anguilla]|uniref:EGF-like domain-containing protein n=1 Tax=Anguilla anguilla TaxID=7936 RepID=A0A9D3M1D2_ANGAN|nr:hypothetical protein ANANG_G00192340 [Anguilla anguilla]